MEFSFVGKAYLVIYGRTENESELRRKAGQMGLEIRLWPPRIDRTRRFVSFCLLYDSDVLTMEGVVAALREWDQINGIGSWAANIENNAWLEVYTADPEFLQFALSAEDLQFLSSLHVGVALKHGSEGRKPSSTTDGGM